MKLASGGTYPFIYKLASNHTLRWQWKMELGKNTFSTYLEKHFSMIRRHRGIFEKR